MVLSLRRSESSISCHSSTIDTFSGLSDSIRRAVSPVGVRTLSAKSYPAMPHMDPSLAGFFVFVPDSGVGVGALRYGLPLIVSDCGSLPELVKDPASVVEPGNAQQLAARLVRRGFDVRVLTRRYRSLAGFEETARLGRHDLGNGEAIVDLCEVDVLGLAAGHGDIPL